MFSGFSVFSLERELSSLEKRREAIRNKIEDVRKGGNIRRGLKSLKLPPINPQRSGTPKIQTVHPITRSDSSLERESSFVLPSLSPRKPEAYDGNVSSFSPRPPSSRKTSRPNSASKGRYEYYGTRSTTFHSLPFAKI